MDYSSIVRSSLPHHTTHGLRRAVDNHVAKGRVAEKAKGDFRFDHGYITKFNLVFWFDINKIRLKILLRMIFVVAFQEGARVGH